MAVHALLVGIDAYQGQVPPLRGAVADVRRAAEFLRIRVPAGELSPLLLTDAAATRAAVIDGFRSHLAAAGPGDSALFWFSGHGSELPVPAWLERTETTGFLQTLVCADSRVNGTPDLLDKEIRILISRIAERGTHVVAVFDCCHSDGAGRPGGLWETPAFAANGPPPALGVRWAPTSREVPPPRLLLPELAESGERLRRLLGKPGNHVSLAACRSFESAHEIPADGGHRGVFSLMLLRRLTDPAITYRELLASTRSLVETEVPGQHPVLDPVVGPLPDQPFLGGRAAGGGPAAMTLRRTSGRWHVDAGSCHGMTAGTAAEPMLLGVRDDPLRRQLRVTSVRPDWSGVEAVGWQPADTDLGSQLVVTRVPFPRATVVIGDRNRSGSGSGSVPGPTGPVTRLVAHALDHAGPGGDAPSPFLRRLASDEAHTLATLRVAVPTPETVVICGSDGTRLDAPMRCATSVHALEVVRRLEHIARWRDVLELDNPCTRLAGAVAIDVVEVLDGEQIDPVVRAPLITGADGAVHLSYRYTAHGWAPPHGVFLRLRNTSDRMLYCVLLNLTDRFLMHPHLFPGGWVGPGSTAYIGEGCVVGMTLPPGRVAERGARGVDWLKVLVAEAPIDAALFELPRLGEPAAPRAPAVRTAGLGGVVDRLGHAAMFRDLPSAAPAAVEWTTAVVTVVTSGPER